jgi:hypothetical protein
MGNPLFSSRMTTVGPYLKKGIWVCQAYRDFIRGQACLQISAGCRGLAPSDPHHEREGADGGTALKPSDVYLVPLCHTCHLFRHSSKFNMTPEYLTRARGVMLRTLASFLSGMTVRRKP